MKRRNFLQATTLLPFVGAAVFVNEKAHAARSIETLQQDDGQRDFFFKPAGAWPGDFIPFYAEGAFQLFYLHDWRDEKNHGEGTAWYRISTNDFVQFKEYGEMIPRGSAKEQDLYVFTGSAIAAKGKYHIFYTGHNPYFPNDNKPLEAVMHAVSDDMLHWTKLPADTFFAPQHGYEKNDWRDPFVFWDDSTSLYHMLVAARFDKGIPRRRGLTAHCTSADLTHWEVKEPFYAPDFFYTHECPDLFKMGDWYYLVFSEFSDLVRTRYRMSRSMFGPWITPEKEDFDGHAFYAAKTASDGHRRYIFGWNPTKDGDKDSGGWQWGGNLVVHELQQQKNGLLTTGLPAAVAGAFKQAQPLHLTAGAGKVQVNDNSVAIHAAEGFGAAVAGTLPERCKLSMNIHFKKNAKGCGLMLHTSDDLEQAYYIRLEPLRARMVFDAWPRERSELPYQAELERSMEVQDENTMQLEVVMDGSVGVAYLNNKIAMNFRMYNLTGGNWGLFASNGDVAFSDIHLHTM